MELKNKTFLLISPEPWSHLFVSKHHYAIHLGDRGNKVFFLNPPIRRSSIKITATEYSGVSSVNYSGFLKGLRFLPQFIQKYLIKRKYEQLEKACGLHFDIVWSFDNSVFFDFSALPKAVLCISHIVDLNQDFQTQTAAQTADICLGTSREICRELITYNSNCYQINHGAPLSANLKRFQMPGNNEIKCLYAGNIDIQYLDWELILKLITAYPNIDFIFVGKWELEKEKKKLLSYNNFFYLGIVHATELIAYYQSADILLITYLFSKYPEQLSNPHKLMGYLASGKMVVASWTAEYEELYKKDLILMAKNHFNYLTIFDLTVKDLDYWNSSSKQAKRIAFALDNTYDKQIDKIEKLLDQI